MKFSFRQGNLELRSTVSGSLYGSGAHTTAEIVKWYVELSGKDYCYVLAYWIKHNDGYDL